MPSRQTRQKCQGLKLNALKAAVKKGEDSGKGIAANEVFKDVRRLLATLAAADRTRHQG